MKLSVLLAVFMVTMASTSYAALKAGTPAPSFTQVTTSEDSISLYDYRGQIVILHFWKSN